jgi:hypothetical protein
MYDYRTVSFVAMHHAQFTADIAFRSSTHKGDTDNETMTIQAPRYGRNETPTFNLIKFQRIIIASGEV